MKLRVELGLNGTKREFNWWKTLKDFPSLISHAGKKWEWITYDEDRSKSVDYILVFAQLSTYDPNNYAMAESLDNLTGDTSGLGCECGAIYTSFPWDHMRFCRKWTRW